MKIVPMATAGSRRQQQPHKADQMFEFGPLAELVRHKPPGQLRSNCWTTAESWDQTKEMIWLALHSRRKAAISRRERPHRKLRTPPLGLRWWSG